MGILQRRPIFTNAHSAKIIYTGTMTMRHTSQLDPRKRYLQVALNGTLSDAARVIATLPANDRIIIEAGTPLIKRYGMQAISNIHDWWVAQLAGMSTRPQVDMLQVGGIVGMLLKTAEQQQKKQA